MSGVLDTAELHCFDEACSTNRVVATATITDGKVSDYTLAPNTTTEVALKGLPVAEFMLLDVHHHPVDQWIFHRITRPEADGYTVIPTLPSPALTGS